MANGKLSDPQEYVLHCGGRSGINREFVFAAKSQENIPNSLGQTRSCQASAVAPAAPLYCGSKRPKVSVDREEQPPVPPYAYIIALPAVIPMEVDTQPSDKRHTGYQKRGVCAPIPARSEGKLKKDDIGLDSRVSSDCNEGLKKDLIPGDRSITNCKGLMSEVSNSQLKNGSAAKQSILVHGDSHFTIGNRLAVKPSWRFTRSASNPSKMKEEENPGEEKATRTLTRPSLKAPMLADDQRGVAATLHTVQVENLVEIPIILDNCGGIDVENGQLDESVRAAYEGLVSVTLATEFNKGNELDYAILLENPTTSPITKRRCTRSLLKDAVEESAAVDASAVTIVNSVHLDESKGDNAALNGRLSTMLKKKMELKMSKKITLTKLPSNIKDLLGTGLLEGLPVIYTSCPGKKVGLQGVIRGTGILCSCTSCRGATVVSIYQFEIHAGSTNKHPSKFIFFRNGKNLCEVLRSCIGVSLNMLEAVIQNAIGPLSPKKLSLCEKCKGTGKFSLCNLCVKQNHQQEIPTASNGLSSSPKLLGRILVPFVCDGIPMNSSSPKMFTYGKLTKKDLGLHKLVFMDDILPQGTERLLEGYIKDSGIFCRCCSNMSFAV
ncbi:hypothetical protein KSP40_PGU013816 [Platanthera guangdongensis]|uniref:Tify domain-containing protein n=1 Tax=Platanthera guangdongensis TaxID=2320717 RepID=A0ABR2MMW1_9ASPA